MMGNIINLFLTIIIIMIIQEIVFIMFDLFVKGKGNVSIFKIKYINK